MSGILVFKYFKLMIFLFSLKLLIFIDDSGESRFSLFIIVFFKAGEMAIWLGLKLLLG